MPEPVPPGDPGYDDDRWFQHVVNTGLRLAQQVGTGLSLFNALRSRFQGVARDILGSATTILGQGIRAAAAWMQGGPDYVVPIETLPLAPRGFFGPEEVNRIVGLLDVPGYDSDRDRETYHTTRINFPEDWSKAAIEEITDEVMQQSEDESPEGWARLEDWEQRQHMLWIGRKY